jgi:hypothetical protein
MPYSTADNSLSEFVAGGGYMLFSSEEVLGTLTDWADVSFSPGDFVYDVLGVGWVGNDYGYLEVIAGDDGGTGLIAGLPSEDIPLDVSFMEATGSMADICIRFTGIHRRSSRHPSVLTILVMMSTTMPAPSMGMSFSWHSIFPCFRMQYSRPC